MELDSLIQAVGHIAIGNKVGGFGLRHPNLRPHNNAGQPHTADGGPEQGAVGIITAALRLKMEDTAVGNQQFHGHHMIAEGAGRMVVLAMNIGANSTTNSDLASARQNRNPQAIRQCCLHQLIQRHTAVDINNGAVGIDGVDLVESLHIDNQATGVLCRIAIRAAHTAGDNTALQVRGLRRILFRHRGHGLGDDVQVGSAQHFTGSGGSASPAGERASSGGQCFFGVGSVAIGRSAGGGRALSVRHRL